MGTATRLEDTTLPIVDGTAEIAANPLAPMDSTLAELLHMIARTPLRSVWYEKGKKGSNFLFVGMLCGLFVGMLCDADS